MALNYSDSLPTSNLVYSDTPPPDTFQPTPKEQEVINELKAGGLGMIQGATFGLAPYVGAVSHMLNGVPYKEGLAIEKQRYNDAESQYPIASFVGGVASGLPLGFAGTAKSVVPRSLGRELGSKLTPAEAYKLPVNATDYVSKNPALTAKQAVGLNVGTGIVQGAASSNNLDPYEIAQNATLGGIAGGVLGVGGQALANGPIALSNIYGKVANYAKPTSETLAKMNSADKILSKTAGQVTQGLTQAKDAAVDEINRSMEYSSYTPQVKKVIQDLLEANHISSIFNVPVRVPAEAKYTPVELQQKIFQTEFQKLNAGQGSDLLHLPIPEFKPKESVNKAVKVISDTVGGSTGATLGGYIGGPTGAGLGGAGGAYIGNEIGNTVNSFMNEKGISELEKAARAANNKAVIDAHQIFNPNPQEYVHPNLDPTTATFGQVIDKMPTAEESSVDKELKRIISLGVITKDGVPVTKFSPESVNRGVQAFADNTNAIKTATQGQANNLGFIGANAIRSGDATISNDAPNYSLPGDRLINLSNSIK